MFSGLSGQVVAFPALQLTHVSPFIFNQRFYGWSAIEFTEIQQCFLV